MDKDIKEIKLIGTKLSLLCEDELLTIIESSIKQNKRQIKILSGNIHSYNTAYKYEWYRKFLNSSEFVRLDGAGVRLGAKLLGFSTPNRATWADFAWSLAKMAEKNSFSLYFLGGLPGIAEQAEKTLKTSYPKLNVSGINHGYFDKNKNSEENKIIIEKINQAAPDILIVGFGMPIQEKWILENSSDLLVSVILTGGAIFDYISGNLKRSPKWMNKLGFEWLGRLMNEPCRLWKRYIIGNPVFLWRVLMQRFGILKFKDE